MADELQKVREQLSQMQENQPKSVKENLMAKVGRLQEKIINLSERLSAVKGRLVETAAQAVNAFKEKKEYVGKNTKVFMLIEGKNLISFCTFADKDDIQPTELTPWIGWVYTFPNYRGHRYVGKLLSYVEELAKVDGINNIYVSTNHNGLYEKYG